MRFNYNDRDGYSSGFSVSLSCALDCGREIGTFSPQEKLPYVDWDKAINGFGWKSIGNEYYCPNCWDRIYKISQSLERPGK